MKEVALRHNVGFVNTEEVFRMYTQEFIENGLKQYEDFPIDKVYFRFLDPALITKFDSEEMFKLRGWNYFFIDPYHPSPCGHQIIAEELYKYLLDKKILTRNIFTQPN